MSLICLNLPGTVTPSISTPCPANFYLVILPSTLSTITPRTFNTTLPKVFFLGTIVATTKSSQTADEIAAPPPSYEMHTTYTAATESYSRSNGYSLFRNVVILPTPDTSYARYQSHRRKFRYSIALNIFLLLIVIPLAFIGFALIHNASNDNSDTGSITSNDASVAISPITDAFAGLNPRGDDGPPRRCITGFTILELNEAFNNIQKNHDNKQRIWMAPCSEVADIDYTNKGLKAEYDYVFV